MGPRCGTERHQRLCPRICLVVTHTQHSHYRRYKPTEPRFLKLLGQNNILTHIFTVNQVKSSHAVRRRKNMDLLWITLIL